MPISYQFESDGRTIRTKCMGLVTLQEVVNHFRTLQQDPACPEGLDVFLDLSEVESVPEAGQISTVVTEIKRIRGQVRFGACAIVARGDALFGMMRMFEAHAEQLFRVTRAFRVAAEAEMWLREEQAGTTPKATNGTQG